MGKIHKAVCKAAGWQAYCDKCGSAMRRGVGLGTGYSYCPNEKCPSHYEAPKPPYWIDDEEHS